MRVLFLNYEYPPLGGGAANATAYILREFSKIPNLEVDLVTSSIDENYHLEKIGENISIHRLPIGKNKNNLHFQSQKDVVIYSWKAFWFGRKLIKQGNYNLTHSFFTVPCGFLSMAYHRLYKIPYIVSLRGADVPGYSERFLFIYFILKPLIKLIWKKSSAVVSNSQGLKDLALQTRPEQEISIVYNGIDIEAFKPAELEHQMSKFIITTGASRVTHRKGLNYLIAAVAKLAPKYPNISVKIMGDGNAKKELETLAEKLDTQERVEFLGRIAREETAPFYQEAGVFVLPSLNEGMSNAMLEALASGLPIVATDTGGSKELIKEGENGFIIKFKDSDDIAEKLEILINNSELVRSMGQASRRRAEKMSWQKVAEEYYKLYEQKTT